MRKLTHEELAGYRIPPDQINQVDRLPLWGLLDNIRSLYNVGSIFRTSDGARITKLFLCGYTPTPPRKEIEKTSLGSTKSVPWEYSSSALDAVAALKSQGITLCVLEHTSRSIPYYRVERKSFPLCLVVGNELTGVSPGVIAAADMAIEIPMFGMKQSLNAAVAYGIALFELVRIWQSIPGQALSFDARVK